MTDHFDCLTTLLVLASNHFCISSETHAFFIQCKKQYNVPSHQTVIVEGVECVCVCVCAGGRLLSVAVCWAVTPPVISLTRLRQRDRNPPLHAALVGTQRPTSHVKTLVAPSAARASPGKNVYYLGLCRQNIFITCYIFNATRFIVACSRHLHHVSCLDREAGMSELLTIVCTPGGGESLRERERERVRALLRERERDL